jgi:hypothetical protein
MENQVPVFISLRTRMAQLYPQAMDSIFVTSYGSQGYGGDIRIRLHTANCNSSQRYVTTGGQSASLSWCQAPTWGPRPDLYCCQTVLDLFLCGAPSLTRGPICHLQLLLVLASAVIYGYESGGTQDHILLFQIQDFPNLEEQVPVFISPRIRVTHLYPQVLGSLFVASYDSQGYSGGIRTRLHAEAD